MQCPERSDPSVRPTRIGDFNGDGRLDLLGPVNDTIAVWLGNGDATFQNPRYTPLEVSSGELALGDVNTDGVTDLVVVPVGGYDGTPFMRLLLGNGDGTFRPSGSYLPGQQFGAAVLADFNGDRRLDVVATFYKDSLFFPHLASAYYVSVWPGNGDGTLSPPIDFRVDHQAGAVAAGHLNSDRSRDVIVPYLGSDLNSFADSRLVVLRGAGGGSFQCPMVKSVSPYARPLSAVTADVNRDGRLDVVVANWEMGYQVNTPVSILLNNGNGTLENPENYDAHFGRQWLALADFNRDGFTDIVVYNSDSWDLSVLINAADWAPAPSCRPGLQGP